MIILFKMINRKRAVKIFVINTKKEILMQLRDKKPEIPYAGYWSLLGGAVEEGESDLEAIKREIKEEINYELEGIRKIGITKSLGKNKNYDLTFFKAKINVPLSKIRLNEGQRVEFFGLDKIFKLRSPNFVKKFIAENRRKII